MLGTAACVGDGTQRGLLVPARYSVYLLYSFDLQIRTAEQVRGNLQILTAKEAGYGGHGDVETTQFACFAGTTYKY